MAEIKRELWKNGFFVVAREKGKIVTRRKWQPKEFNLTIARKKFKADKTFKANEKRNKLVNVTEVKDFSDKPSLRKGFKKVQWFVEGFVRDGKKRVRIHARSQQYSVEEIRSGMISVNNLQDEARSSFFERVAQAFGLQYDEDEGQALTINGNAVITKEGLVHYEALR